MCRASRVNKQCVRRTNKNMNANASGNIKVLFEHVFSEEKSEKFGSRRFAIRVLECGENHSLSVGISRQWLAPDGHWLPANKGHSYFPTKSWDELVACIGEVDTQIKACLENGNAGRVGFGYQGSAQPQHGGNGGYAPNATTESNGTEPTITIDESVTASTAPPSVYTKPPKAHMSTIYRGSNYKRGGANGGDANHRDGAKSAYIR